MSLNVHHTTFLSLAAGLTFTSQPTSKEKIQFSSGAFNTTFIGLNLASAIYDMIPRQKTLVKTKQVLTTDDEGNTYNTKVTEMKKYNVTQFNIDSIIKLEMVFFTLLFDIPNNTHFFALGGNIAQGIFDITGISDYCTNIYAYEINSDESFSIL